MFCRNCGAQLKEGSAFCGMCGSAVAVPQTASIQNAAPQNAAMRSDAAKNAAVLNAEVAPAGGIPLQPKKKSKLPIIIGVAAAAAVVIALVAVFVLMGGGGGNGSGSGGPIYVVTEVQGFKGEQGNSFSYDNAGNLSEMVWPGGNSASYEHDANGYVTALSRHEYQNEFDDAGRLIKCTSSQGFDFEFEYYDDGSLKEYRSKHDHLTFDENGYPIVHEWIHGSDYWTTEQFSWTFDSNGNPESYTVTIIPGDPSSGSHTEQYTVKTDEAGNIVEIYGPNAYGETVLQAAFKYEKIDAPSQAARVFAPYFLIAGSCGDYPGTTSCDYPYLIS